MTDENRYVKRGHASILDDHGINDEEPWDFEQEAWGVDPQPSSGPMASISGIHAAVEQIGRFDKCYVTRLEFIRPRIPADAPEKLLTIFPAAFTYPSWTTWILGFENFLINRQTGCREVTLYTQSDPHQVHLKDPPDRKITYKHRYYVLEPTEIPSWIKEHM